MLDWRFDVVEVRTWKTGDVYVVVLYYSHIVVFEYNTTDKLPLCSMFNSYIWKRQRSRRVEIATPWVVSLVACVVYLPACRFSMCPIVHITRNDVFLALKIQDEGAPPLAGWGISRRTQSTILRPLKGILIRTATSICVHPPSLRAVNINNTPIRHCCGIGWAQVRRTRQRSTSH